MESAPGAGTANSKALLPEGATLAEGAAPEKGAAGEATGRV